MSSQNDNSAKWGLAAAAGAALAASACCVIPLLLVALGLGGAWVSTFTALEPFRPLFIALAVGFLGYAGYREYRTSSGPDCDCEVTMQDKLRRALLVVGSVATIGLIVSPWIIRDTASAEPGDASVLSSVALQEVELEIEGMTCSTCPITVRKALEQVDGVELADVTFEPPRAAVAYDPSRASVDDLIRATAEAGYPSRMLSVAAAEQVVLEVEGMTCASCNITVRKALTNLEGVQDARVTFEPPEAVVTYDPARVTPEQLTAATTSVGYPSNVKGGS